MFNFIKRYFTSVVTILLVLLISLQMFAAENRKKYNLTIKNLSSWDYDNGQLVIKILGTINRPWMEVKNTIDPINWIRCSKYFYGSYLVNSNIQKPIPGESWQGSFILNERIRRDMTQIPDANRWYLKWSNKREIFARSLFAITTDLNENSYRVQYNILENYKASVMPYNDITPITFYFKVPINGEMVKNDGFVMVEKIDENSTKFELYKEVKFKSEFMTNEFEFAGKELISPVVEDMVKDWITCQN